VTEHSAPRAGAASASAKIVRHALVDRVFHWVTAVCVLVLLATAFLPIVGVEFGWVTPHWITGVVLLVAVAFHVVRGFFWQSLRTVWIGAADIREALAIVRSTLRFGKGPEPPKPGKYSFAQKLIHLAFAVVVLAVSVTGAFMLARVNTPWWKSNPYLLADKTWGLVYVLHDLAALLLITMVMTHVYFALRPEKLLFTRAMIRGWITREEFGEHHDPSRWQVDR
jgi:cytochrome b subunit of formate dehydrogenase